MSTFILRRLWDRRHWRAFRQLGSLSFKVLRLTQGSADRSQRRYKEDVQYATMIDPLSTTTTATTATTTTTTTTAATAMPDEQQQDQQPQQSQRRRDRVPYSCGMFGSCFSATVPRQRSFSQKASCAIELARVAESQAGDSEALGDL